MNLNAKNCNDVQYGELQVGDLFRYDGKTYIMIDELVEVGFDRLHVSVDLKSGKMKNFDPKVVVQRYENPILVVE